MKVYKPEKVEKVWGKELWIANNNEYCGKILILNKGYRCSIHYHKIKDETFYILIGKVLMEVSGESCVMEPGDAVHLTPGIYHRFTGLDDSQIAEFSTHHEDDDSYRIELSGKA
jgi:quercetin dioxygenase-like cupin family protein